MKARKQFDVNIIQLSETKHDYEFEVESSFFQEFEDSFAQKGKLQIDVVLNKSTTMIQANFKIKGTVELICDRSLEPYDQEVLSEENLIFKYGEEYSELTEEIIIIPRDLPTLNLSQFIYEFIGLAVPMKKLHPKFRTDENIDDWEDEEEEGILIYSTLSEDDEEEEAEESTEDEPSDPRWELLKNIKKNLN